MLKLSLTALSFAIAFGQRWGETTADTKIDLHVDPAGFLADVAQVWSTSGGLGQVQAGQYSGYLWPMGPFFWLGDAIGLDAWVVHRLWLGMLLAVAALGAVKLLEELLDDRSNAALAVAGLVYLVNPYVTTFTQVTSVTLLGYAALPWLMLAVHRGLRSHGRWWWPAFFALVFTSTGGGVNAAVSAWLLLGPALLLIFEARAGKGPVPFRGFAARTALLTIVASLWWVVPVAVHARFGINFLPYTESVGAIWTTTSLPESLRLMGFWLSYIGGGFGNVPLAYFDASRQLLFSQPVVVASLVVPGLAVAGLVWTRRWRYAPFFLLLLLAGLLVMTVGFPEGTPFRRALTKTYNEVEAVQFLRTTYKAAPLVALALACLAGAAAHELWCRVQATRLRALLVAAGLGLLALGSWPLVTGRAIDEKFAFDEVPGEWQTAAAGIDDTLGPNARALILPGQLYAFYDWGAPVDPILPALAERPVTSRTAVPYADLHAVDALWTVDAGIQQERFVPGQLEPLLEWLAVGAVVTGTDDDIDRSGATAPAEAARSLAIAGLAGEPARYGPAHRFEADPGSLTRPVELPRVRTYDTAPAALVRVEPRSGGVLLDGSAEGVAALAAFGELDPSRPLTYAGDLDSGGLLDGMPDELVITDSNRRRTVSPARPRQSWGRTLLAAEDTPPDAPTVDPFSDDTADGQTVAVLDGAAELHSPFASGFPQFPEHRPFAAFDGDPATWWEPDREVESSGRWVEIRFDAPRDVPWVEIVPRRQQATSVTAVEIGGLHFPVHEGANRIDLRLSDVDRLRVRVAGRDLPDGRRGGPGAIAEIRVPGVHVEELLRPPRRLEDAAATADLSRTAISYVFTRTTADRPFRRHPLHDPDAAAVPDDWSIEPALIREAADPEREIVREIEPPSRRDYELDAWATVAPDAPDPALDRLAGYRGPAVFRSSDRYEGRAGVRASSAFDGRLATAWVGRAMPGREPWLEWEAPTRATVERLELLRPPPPGSLPRSVSLEVDGEEGAQVRVRSGVAELPEPVSGRRFRLQIEEPGSEAVGIGEVRGAGVPRASVPATGELRGSCGDLSVRAASGSAALRVSGTVEELNSAAPLRAQGCGRLGLAGGRQAVRVEGGVLLPYLVRLRSPAPGARVPRAVGSVTDPGEANGSHRDGVQLDLAAPARLVLAESFNRGWRATCDGHDLGEPEVAAGYANGWDVPADCEDVDFTFGPQRVVELGYFVSGGVCVLLLLFLLLGWRGRRKLPADPVREPGDRPLRRLPLPAAGAIALALAAAVAFVFALRAGAVAFPLLVLLFWRGASVRALLAGAGVLLAVVVPLLYLLFPPVDRGGHNSSFASETLGAHWVAVAAYVLLAIAVLRILPRRTQ